MPPYSGKPDRKTARSLADDRQSLRLRRFSMAALSAVVTFLMLGTLYMHGLMEGRTILGGTMAMGLGLAVFFIAFKRGWNLKAKDPSLTGPMMLLSAAVIFLLMFDSATARATMGAYLCVIMLFGVFRYPTVVLMKTAIIFLCVYAGMLGVLWLRGAPATDMAMDMGRLIVMACVLPLVAWVGGHINSLRNTLHDRKVFFQTIWDTCKEVVVVMDGEGLIRYTNPAMKTVFDRDPASMIGMHAGSLQPAHVDVTHRMLHAVQTLEGPGAKASFETEGVRADGTRLPLEITLSRAYLEGTDMVVAFLSDITKRKMAEDQIKHLAQHDPLTGLPNRAMMHERLAHALALAGRQQGAVWVLFLDFDRFKLINDSLGHKVGDIVLTTMAARMVEVCRETDTVARLGGDEFVMILSETRGGKLSESIIERLMAKLARPIRVNGHELLLTSSIGISVFPEDGATVDSLVEHADVAMYRAKQNGRNNFCFYTASMNDAAIARLELESDLRNALQRDEFRLHYQPQVDVASGDTVGAEALLRWQHPTKGLVPPAAFIPMAEETGLIVPIGAWVIRAACEQQRKWMNDGLPPMRISVNLSPRQFAETDLVETIQSILIETRIDPTYLELELTEGMLMSDVDLAEKRLAQLKRLGVHLSIDDFGTGYSSLAYLKRFPIDVLKIDRSFVKDLSNEDNSKAIVMAIITLAKAMKLHVVAEGVELLEQEEYLRKACCDRIQGYLVSAPLPALEFKENFLEKGALQAA
ncbi:putative bifunctional diguanylate cyclase/phosphodiesterase [Noviherbaspirillum aerium]|uniref:putative bifunctional diguanylate cyclase/phosphodiesterase n=1 Tax=Noviherbaspirillum aerium TaxID=2588497 RepID=UPI00124E9DCC|nr:EAL domain-containing protein [Noviherbaspirillum aerium]